jgi:SRSO17 transposase
VFGRGTAAIHRHRGKITNCQIGVFLGYASPRGRTLVDRELYLPRDSWATDPHRRARTKLPEHVTFATKPELPRVMIERAISAGVPFLMGDRR